MAMNARRRSIATMTRDRKNTDVIPEMKFAAVAIQRSIELARVIREYNPKTKITEDSLKPLTYHPNQSNITLSKVIPIYLFSSYPHSRAVIRTA